MSEGKRKGRWEGRKMWLEESELYGNNCKQS